MRIFASPCTSDKAMPPIIRRVLIGLGRFNRIAMLNATIVASNKPKNATDVVTASSGGFVHLCQVSSLAKLVTSTKPSAIPSAMRDMMDCRRVSFIASPPAFAATSIRTRCFPLRGVFLVAPPSGVSLWYDSAHPPICFDIEDKRNELICLICYEQPLQKIFSCIRCW